MWFTALVKFFVTLSKQKMKIEVTDLMLKLSRCLYRHNGIV